MLHATVKSVVLRKCFCILQGLVALINIGVFASVVIKKRQYWPRHVPGQEIYKYTKKNTLEMLPIYVVN